MSEKVPCKVCSTLTLGTGTELCDRCWEVHNRLPRFIVDAGTPYLRNLLATVRKQLRDRDVGAASAHDQVLKNQVVIMRALNVLTRSSSIADALQTRMLETAILVGRDESEPIKCPKCGVIVLEEGECVLCREEVMTLKIEQTLKVLNGRISQTYRDIDNIGEGEGDEGVSLDGASEDWLMTFWFIVHHHPAKVAGMLFPKRPIEETQPVTETLGAYACAKATAISYRLKGNIPSAQTYEKHADIYYDDLPEWARW